MPDDRQAGGESIQPVDVINVVMGGNQGAVVMIHALAQEARDLFGLVGKRGGIHDDQTLFGLDGHTVHQRVPVAGEHVNRIRDSFPKHSAALSEISCKI